jgi:hypothetical protein
MIRGIRRYGAVIADRICELTCWIRDTEREPKKSGPLCFRE